MNKDDAICILEEVLRSRGITNYKQSDRIASDIIMDSLEVMSFIMDIEEKLNVEFDTDSYLKIIDSSITEVVDMITTVIGEK